MEELKEVDEKHELDSNDGTVKSDSKSEENSPRSRIPQELLINHTLKSKSNV